MAALVAVIVAAAASAEEEREEEVRMMPSVSEPTARRAPARGHDAHQSEREVQARLDAGHRVSMSDTTGTDAQATDVATLTEAQYEAVAQAFVSANRAEYEPLDHDAPIEATIARLLVAAQAEAWDAAVEAVRARIFASYSHGDERGEAWVPFMADLLRSLRRQPVPNPHYSPALTEEANRG